MAGCRSLAHSTLVENVAVFGVFAMILVTTLPLVLNSANHLQ